MVCTQGSALLWQIQVIMEFYTGLGNGLLLKNKCQDL